jgi:pre-mRNA-splicing factor ATP-dependent RNA helicase DHX15/PRP43
MKKMQSLQRNNTTAVQAMEIEDMNDHPLRRRPHSARYFDILKARRALPVSNSRQDFLNTYHRQQESKYYLLLSLSTFL